MCKEKSIGTYQGFTLLELLVVIAIVAVITQLGIPNITRFLDSNKANTQINKLVNSIREARTTALTLNVNTIIVPRATDWTQGWQMGIDLEKDGIINTVLRESDTADKLVFETSPETIIFNSRGRTTPTFFSITPSSCSTINPRRDINIALTGYLEITNCDCLSKPCP